MAEDDSDFAPVPHEEAARLIEGKAVVAREVFDRMLPEIRARVFTITGVESANVMQRVRDEIAGLARGQTWDDSKGKIVEALSPYLGNEGDEEREAGTTAVERRAELLLRTHGFQAFQAANWQVAQADEDTTHLQYLATEDDRVRDSHLALNGIVLPKDDEFWAHHYPPWEWGCRCRVRPMNPDMVDEARQGDETRAPDDQWVMEGPALKKLREGTLIRDGRAYDVLPPEGEKAFRFSPDDLRIPVGELESRYDKDIWSAFVDTAKVEMVAEGVTLWEWLNGEKLTADNTDKTGMKPKGKLGTLENRPAEKVNVVEERLQGLGFRKPILEAARELPEEVLKFLGNLNFSFGREAFYKPSLKMIELSRNVKGWKGTVDAFFHEMGHHLHYESGLVTSALVRSDFAAAMQADLAAWEKGVATKHGEGWKAVYKNTNSWGSAEEIGKVMGLGPYDSKKDMPGAKRIARVADTISGLSNGQYGWGHKLSYMTTGTNSAKEVFANAFSAVMEGDATYMAMFPNVVDLLRREFKL